jgi:hypothetical protein
MHLPGLYHSAHTYVYYTSMDMLVSPYS